MLRVPSCAMMFGPGCGGNARGHKTSPNITRTVTNDGRLISEEFSNGHDFLKCASYVFYFYWPSIDLCWLLTLWDVFGGSGTGEGRKFIPILLKQCSAQAWWILPYLFLFHLYFPWGGGLERGVFWKCWTRGVEDEEKNNISPWRENKVKQKNVSGFCLQLLPTICDNWFLKFRDQKYKPA